MAHTDVREWFDEAKFRSDVIQYQHHQRLGDSDLATLSDMSVVTVRSFLAGGSLTVRTAAALSVQCDISLDAYVLTQSQHDQYLNNKARMGV